MKKAAFTICAKNYLAHAYTLKESFIKHNPNTDFFIFLSDRYDQNINDDQLITLDDIWINDWREMAFKYNVIEFSTSIKPFCFKKLFDENYGKVIYLDPDIYVTNNLDEIFLSIEKKSIMLTPHYCKIQTEFSGSVTEEEILFVGIYNLGFTAINNNEVGIKIIEWWINRLANKCYADKFDALHVDQKWMDFIPSFYPNDSLITHHPGINPAIWNLHERELIFENNQYKIKYKVDFNIFPLLFFHFSGFDPYNPKVINRRHPNYNTENYPSFKPLFDEYTKNIYKNGYETYSKFEYSFNSFENGETILQIHRRLFRVLKNGFPKTNPFSDDQYYYKLLKSKKLLSGIKTNSFSNFTENEKQKKNLLLKLIIYSFKFFKMIVGIRYYNTFLKFLNEFSRFENQSFLIKNHDK